MAIVKTIYKIVIISVTGGKKNENVETVSVTGSGQKAANAVDKKFKGKIFKKFFQGFQINDSFIPFERPTIYSH
jgi:hypothetical protein